MIAAWRPQFPVLVTPGSLTRAAAAAAVMALLAAALPARRLARLDPAGALPSGERYRRAPERRAGGHGPLRTVADVTYWFCAAGCRAEFLLHSDHQ